MMMNNNFDYHTDAFELGFGMSETISTRIEFVFDSDQPPHLSRTFGVTCTCLSHVCFGFSVTESLKKKGLDEEYSFSANIPVGKRFKLTDSLAIDAYGLIGYSVLQTKPTVDNSLHGVKYGVGIDLNTSDWLIGIRYSRVNLDYDFDQEDISLLVGYKFKVLDIPYTKGSIGP